LADLEYILKKYWGHEEFRPLQKEIIQSILDGQDTLAILPTGGGKSICFQVPALAGDGICIVISPLIALMKDQVENLRKRDIPALLVHSGMKRTDLIQTLKNATHEYFKFLYVSPERLETSLFNEYLPGLNVNLLAVDEAHCISQWGYDFRPSYLRIAELRKELPGVPVLALTASATEEVQKDICEKLEFKRQHIFRQSFERKNLSYSVFKADSKLAKLVDIVTKVQGSAIVYCRTRKRTNEIVKLLQMHGISCSNYHAGLKQEERNLRQKEWVDGKGRVIVCTNAFGMGIDKPDVRVVVHVDIPDCLENYYQEAGRAGRDGKKAYAVLLYDEKDIRELNELHSIRFPTMEQIRKVYAALTNFLQIPAYTGEYRSFTFRFDDFIRNFKLNSNEAMYSLKALETDRWLDFNEKSFSPATLVFTTSKRELAEFEKHYPEHEPLLTTILRSYGGVFDFPAFISEKLLAKLMKKHEDEIKQQLKIITSFAIISYTPQNEEPQIIFKKNRVPVDDLRINMALYNKRKESFIRRVQTMVAYAKGERCRAAFVNSYFGDDKTGECGICDNCLERKATELSADEFEKIAGMISNQLAQKQQTAADLITEIKTFQKEKAWKVIEFLQAEKKIEADSKGLLRLK
jgi:ATP-dependent DNA helicase RecQ